MHISFGCKSTLFTSQAVMRISNTLISRSTMKTLIRPKTTSEIPLLASLPSLPIPTTAEPDRNVLDAFRIAVALQVAQILNLPHAQPTDLDPIWAGVESGKKEGGDLTIAVPRFRVKGVDPKLLAKKIQDEVSYFPINIYIYHLSHQ